MKRVVTSIYAKKEFVRKQFYLCDSSLIQLLKLSFNHLQFLAHSGISKERLAITTFSINPVLGRLWMFYIKKLLAYNEINADIIVFDSSGRLKPLDNCKVIHLLNIEHGVKMDQAIKRIDSKYIWITDDDIYFSRLNLNSILMKLDSTKRDWVYSVVPRGQTIISDDGFEQNAIGSNSIIFKREIFINEKLSFKVRRTENKAVNWSRGYYDTCDYAHKVSLDRGYRAIIGVHKDDALAFFGTSIAYLKFISTIKAKSDFKNWVYADTDKRSTSEKIGIY